MDDDYRTDVRHAYLEWLRMEAALLQAELVPGFPQDRELRPCGTFAKRFHFPSSPQTWQDVPPPSTRARAMLEAAGVRIPEYCNEAAAT